MNLNTRKFLSHLHRVISPRHCHGLCDRQAIRQSIEIQGAGMGENTLFPPSINHKKVIVKDIWSAVNSSREPLNATALTSMRNESSRESCRFQLRRRSNTTHERDEVDELIHPHGDHPFADVYTSHYHDWCIYVCFDSDLLSSSENSLGPVQRNENKAETYKHGN